MTHAQKYDPLTVIFDLGHSYRKLATLLRGSYLEIGLRHRDVTINPFASSRRRSTCTSCLRSCACCSKATTAIT